MKKTIILAISVCFSLISHAQVAKALTINAGKLSSALTSIEKSTITNLTLTGTIDDRDFKTMRDEMPALSELDISGATVTAYNGTDGTYPYKHDYLANVFPESAFFTLITGSGKTSLTSIILPSSVNSIGDDAFYGCTGLTSIIIPSSVNSIGMYAFDSCSSLTSLAIPPSVISIGMGAFEDCSSLTSVTLPVSVTFIGQAAFFRCSNLNSIYATEIIPVDLNSSIGVFYGVNKNTCILHVPYATSGLYAAANQWKDFTNIVEMPGFKLSSFNKVIEAAQGSTGSIEINSDVTWTALSDQTWLAVNPVTGTGIKQTLTFTAQVNALTTDQRVAKITISAPDQLPQTITVTQKITIDPTKLDAFEADNSVDKASIIKSGDIQQHSIYPFQDSDYASFDLTNAPAQVEVKFNTISSGHQIQLMAADGSTVLSTDKTIINTTLTQNGKYYIKAWNPDSLLIPEYQLCLKIIPIVPDRYEPDNTWQEAKLITPFTEQDDHTIKVVGDVDYVKFTISDAPRTIYVDVTDNRKECKKFEIWLYGTNGTTILNNSNAPRFNCGAYMEYTLPANGTYFLKVGLPQAESGYTRDDYTINLTTNGVAPSINCNSADSLALIAIYNTLNGANWSHKLNWLNGKVQNWQGVTLSSEGRVTKLNLTVNNLKGSIPSDIGQLTALRILNLGNNMYVEIGGEPNNLMSSTLPLSMANLVNLEVLSMDGLCFNSELTDIFPGMAKLRELYLNQNGFTNTQLPVGILSCSKIERLAIENNSFSQLPDVTGLTNLQSFSAFSNLFTFEDLEPNWAVSGFNYSPQRKIGPILTENPVAGTLVTHTVEVGGAHNIYQWYKNDQPIPGQTSNTLRIENVSKSDAGLYHLRVTNFLATQLTLYSETLTLYQKELPIYKALEAFYNSTGGENWTNKTNWLSDEPLTAWDGIYENESGQYSLVRYSNNLIGQLPANMGDLTLFTLISISSNPKLTGSIPESIGNLDRLQTLDLVGNGLNGEIPSSIGNLKNLDQLYLGSNQFSGSIPTTIVNCNNLRIGGLNDNNLENLPNLSAMSKLVVMYIYNNKFEFDDLIPAHLGKLNLYGYAPQQKFGKEEVYNKQSGELLTMTATVGGTGNLYQWYKDGTPLNGKTTNTLDFASLALTDQGSYTCNVFNPSVPNLTLESKAMSVFVNRVLVANAGSDQSVNELSVVTLDGSASSDPDGNPLTYKWSAPAGVTLSLVIAAKPTFTAPEVTADTSYTISLVVNNGKVDSPADQVKITIKQVNKVPVADAGTDQSLNERATVTLDGSASTDADKNMLTYKWSAPAGITLSSTTVAKPTFTVPEVTVNTSYTISLVVNDGLVDSPSDQVVITVKNVVPTVHFSPDWTGNGVDHMNINVVSAKLDDIELEAGDEIGIFDGANCVGAGTLTGTLSQTNTLDIVVSQNDGSGNGFTLGNVISYKLFDKSKDLEISNIPTVYSNMNPSWSTDGKFLIGATAFVELTGLSKITQNIGLNAGWNIISANIIPENLNLKDIFQPLIDDGKLQKVMDETGKTIENFGTFGGWKNNIGNLNSAKGYKVKVLETSSLSVDGTSIKLPMDINLVAGWNIISYPGSNLQDAKAIVQSLIDAGKLKKVMDEAGKTIENYGAFGGWKNSIGNFAPGKGFKVNVAENCTLSISGTTTKAATLIPEVLTSTHFSKVFSGNGTDHMNIILIDLPTSGLMVGDEIGVFDGKYCVGAVAIETDHMMTGSISIPASSNEALTGTVNGFTTGHPVELQLYRGNKTYELKCTILNGVNSFEKDGSLFVKVTASEIPVLQIKDESDQFRCYPNPFAEEITIDIQNSLETKVTVVIYNLLGQQIKTLFNGTNKGQLILKWDGTDDTGQQVVHGVYLCKVNDRTIKVVFAKGK
jgi:Leucine-rich repeat (LRR) protein